MCWTKYKIVFKLEVITFKNILFLQFINTIYVYFIIIKVWKLKKLKLIKYAY